LVGLQEAVIKIKAYNYGHFVINFNKIIIP
jgi:hypothetical protein